LNKVGEVRSVRLDYDISGRSIGTAIANFNSPYEAEEAVRRFNGRKAAGVIISVELYYLNSDRRTGRYDSRGPSNSGRRRDSHPRRGNDDGDRSDAKPYRRSERAARKPKKTLEELDAELTSYMNGGSGDLPKAETNNLTNHHDNNDPISNSSNNSNNSSIQPNHSSNFGDKSSINNANSNSTAAESNNGQHSHAQKDDDEMVLD
jgi:hypothetical protein